MGQSCRTLLASWLSGYQLIAAFLSSLDKLPAYEMAAIDVLDSACQKFVCLASFAALLPESLLAFVFHDNRVARNQHVMLDLMWTGLHVIEGLDPFVLEVVGTVAGQSSMELHHALLKCTLIQMAFLEYRLFYVARNRPWSLCAGAVEQNLSKSISSPRPKGVPQDHVSHSLRELANLGYSQVTLTRALKLLGEASWSSFLVEKIHASTSVVRKHRPELGLNHLMCRAFMHMFAQLLPRTTPLEKTLKALRERWLRVAGRKPQHVSGRQVFVAVLMQKMHITNQARKERGVPEVSSADVMASHGRLWKKLAAEQRKGYEELAMTTRCNLDQHGHELEASIEKQMHDCVQEHQKSQASSSSTMTFTTCQISDVHVATCLDNFQTLQGHQGLVRLKRMKEPVLNRWRQTATRASRPTACACKWGATVSVCGAES